MGEETTILLKKIDDKNKINQDNTSAILDLNNKISYIDNEKDKLKNKI